MIALRFRALALALVLTLTVVGCSRPTLSNGSVSACFRAIPAASQAVHDRKARLLGVHRVPSDKVIQHLPPEDRSRVDADTVVCALAFQGPFAAGQVDKARASDTGRYAIVLVTSRHLQLLHSFVLPTLPKRFRGRFT